MPLRARLAQLEAGCVGNIGEDAGNRKWADAARDRGKEACNAFHTETGDIALQFALHAGEADIDDGCAGLDPVFRHQARNTGGGDEDIVTNVIHVTGEVTDNAATNVVTGHNSINEGSFANSSGLTTVVQNTGANVLIQNATIVNVQFVDP